MAPSVPRKLRAQWTMGVIQAGEALGMAVEERMATFLFLYDDKGPRLNPHVVEKLKPEPGPDGGAGLRLQADHRSQPADPLGDLTAHFSNSTSAEGKPGAQVGGAFGAEPPGWRRLSALLTRSCWQDPPAAAASRPDASPKKRRRRSKPAQSPQKRAGRGTSAAENSSGPVKKRRESKPSPSAEEAPGSASAAPSLPGQWQVQPQREGGGGGGREAENLICLVV